MKKRKHNQGLTLIELIVSIAILAIVVLPLLTAFVVSLKTNAKAKEKMRAIDIAHNFMEGMESTPVTEVMTQLSYPSDKFNLLANHAGLSSMEVLDDGTTYKNVRKIEDIPEDVVNREALFDGSVFRYGMDDYKFLGQKSDKYYFYVGNIPSDKKRYAAMVSIESSKVAVTRNSIGKKYNDFTVADIEAINTRYDAVNTDIVTNAELIADMNLQESLNMTEADLNKVKRTITVKIEHPDAKKRDSKVTLSYSYHCENLLVKDSEGNVVTVSGNNVYRTFDFPKSGFVNEDKYIQVIYDNSSVPVTEDSMLKNVYLFYQPWYTSQQLDILQRKDNIYIDNSNDYDCTVRIVKQRWVDDDVLGALEREYHMRVDIKESVRTGNAHVKIETNLGTNISDDDTMYPDIETAGQATYVYNSGVVDSAKIYNAANEGGTLKKEDAKLWVSTKFGKQEVRDRLYDVKVDIYPVDANPDDIYSGAVKPIVSLTGGLID